jgi:DNA transposition AAA+ family ATPase
MSDFVMQIRQRVTDARRSLDQARAMDDDYAVNLHLGELEGLTRIAEDHGIDVGAEAGETV